MQKHFFHSKGKCMSIFGWIAIFGGRKKGILNPFWAKVCTCVVAGTVGRYGRDAFCAALLTQDKHFSWTGSKNSQSRLLCVCATPMCSLVFLPDKLDFCMTRCSYHFPEFFRWTWEWSGCFKRAPPLDYTHTLHSNVENRRNWTGDNKKET